MLETTSPLPAPPHPVQEAALGRAMLALARSEGHRPRSPEIPPVQVRAAFVRARTVHQVVALVTAQPGARFAELYPRIDMAQEPLRRLLSDLLRCGILQARFGAGFHRRDRHFHIGSLARLDEITG